MSWDRDELCESNCERTTVSTQFTAIACCCKVAVFLNDAWTISAWVAQLSHALSPCRLNHASNHRLVAADTAHWVYVFTHSQEANIEVGVSYMLSAR